jgi:hypothetical protein
VMVGRKAREGELYYHNWHQCQLIRLHRSDRA